ncbi:helix-turn-helix domain-containing protein [Streptomyces sp. NBC_00882]|uniref:helix-turn-helix transcriptional regulator n=1 Tax=Streptomyces sp. NBC_00882 TaxID=2975856 RepID=UPI00386A800E|nr:helix-turn-helix domain-containing protein [Streptomyces canus]WSZ34983.1 helix-turn-helix domain-containing protein [Streptomyces sp. NBC_00882]
MPVAVRPGQKRQGPTHPEISDALRPSSEPATAPLLTGVGRAFLNVRDAAEYLGLSPHTLYVWRHRRQGPPSFRMGRRGRVMYRLEALDAWVREQEQADSRSNTTLSPLTAAPQTRPDYETGA